MDSYNPQDVIDSMTGLPRLNRRGFAVTALATGFAMAVRPVSATTIGTDANGLTAGEVKVPVKDGGMPAYRAMPATGGPFPTVVVIHEIFDVHEHIKDLCRRLAKAGYYAIAPSLYARYGDVSKFSDMKDIMPVVGKTTDEQIKADLDSTISFAKGEKANTAKLGVTGFCWGGGQTWIYAAENPSVKAGVAWYGPLNARIPPGPGLTPIAVADKVKGRVLGLYAGKDGLINEEARNQMKAALKAAGDAKSEIVLYPDAQHGFNADYRPSYNEEAAKDGWTRMLAWFKAHGVA